jgi:SAM-dependent methyltransferase
MTSPNEKISDKFMCWLRPRILVFISIFLVAVCLSLIWGLIQQWDLTHAMLLAVVGYVTLRTIYEITLNKGNVPTMGTGLIERGKITALLKQDALDRDKKTYSIIDLGSGRGGLTQQIARSLPQAKVIGIESSKFPHWQARMVQRLFGPKNVSYQCLDFMSYDCADVDAVVMYLSWSFAEVVGKKLRSELKPGALIISNTFALRGDWEPVETITMHTPFEVTLYIYRQR